MSIRQIEYTVTADGLNPSVKQFGGVQGDHRSTEIVFKISAALYAALSEQAETSGGKLIYRCDGFDGEGGAARSDTNDLTEQVTYHLEEWLTRYGGIVRVVLVISLLRDNSTEMELYSFPAMLQLKNLPEGSDTDGESHESMSVLAQVAKDSAETAVEAKDIAVTAQVKTEEARAALEGDVVWVFDGGDASGEVEIDLVVDGEMSDESINPVQNKVIKKYVDDETAVLTETMDNIKEDVKNINDDAVFNQDFKQLLLDIEHPIGSIWVGGKYEATGDPINPADLFGGRWELIDKEFKSNSIADTENTGRMFTVDTSSIAEINNYEVYAIYSGHTIRLRLKVKPSIGFNTDDKVRFGYFVLSELGITSFYHSILSIPLMGDAGGGLLMGNIGTDGEVYINDTIKETVANDLYINETIVCKSDKMLNEFCDKFYWKRIDSVEVEG